MAIKHRNKLSCDCEVIHEEVVNHVAAMMPKGKEFVALANLYKSFSDPTRVKILWALHINEMCVCDLAVLLGMTKSAISHQLRNLRMNNLVKFRRHGKVVYYSLSDAHVRDIFEQGFAHTHH